MAKSASNKKASRRKGRNAKKSIINPPKVRKRNNEGTKSTFPIQKIHEMFQTAFVGGDVDLEATIYLTAVMEYIAAEILEIAGNMAKSSSTRTSNRITHEEIDEAIVHDVELNHLVMGAQH